MQYVLVFNTLFSKLHDLCSGASTPRADECAGGFLSMNIYLVRVSKQVSGSLCIEYKPHATTDDDYIAISHVWGTP